MKLPKEVKCVIFDMDGVIIDSEEIHKKAYYETFGSIGVTVSDDLYKTITGSSTINAFQKLVTYFNLTLNPEDLVLAKRKRYVNFFENDPTLHLVKGVEELIKYFYNKGFTLILASSSAMVNIDRVFNRFKLNTYFTAKISGADLKASKPHPEIFEKAAILGSTPKENCIVIEDSDNGVKAANDAGIFVFGYRNPMAEDQTLENADFVIEEFNEIKELI
ncbi:haloacid dehalogenase superfamily, subfamily IA, variant 3 with third motif having DD or ED [Polaribacter sp. Hel1_33_78]|uniref:HAD family hydrolase n=1 Tax=Polaribacter sp. Hel1_33_78 TaxID=1336804 RepID=UPI00087A5FE5|nr:HAD family phosphatase [Polaribacter sp. Hel1_33_78]SDU05755.1 haloacid dehalogenase superfamily, subfamily IA, variant 3 with third motif having DD or ED [Polaribacter sp. Hel1_33_78]